MAAALISAVAAGYQIQSAGGFCSSFETVGTVGSVTVAVDDLSNCMIIAENLASAVVADLVIRAGDMSGKGIGDKTYSLTSAATYVYGLLDTTRFKKYTSQSSAGTAGTIGFYSTAGNISIGVIQFKY